MKTYGIALVAVAVLSLAGCGGAGGTADGTVTTPVSAKPLLPAATVAQYASLVAEKHLSMSKLLDEMLSRDCDWSTPGNVDARPGYTTCSADLEVMHGWAENMTFALRDGVNGRSLSLGRPPAEIEHLVTATLLDADYLRMRSADAAPCITAAPPADCPATLSALVDGMNWMQQGFAAWTPYGV